MKATTQLLLCLFLGIAYGEHCKRPFIQLGEGCYFFVNVYKEWSEARLYCQSLSATYQVDLAVLDLKPDDFRHISQHATSLEYYEYWIGGSEEAHDGYWTWVDDRPIDLRRSYFDPDNPFNMSRIQQLTMERVQEKLPRWRLTTNWQGALRFICQQEMPQENLEV